MLARVLKFQLLLAVIGAFVLLCGMLTDLHWLAAAGLAASAGSELLGLALAKLPANSPALRLMQSTSMALPSVAVSMLMPGALLVAVAVVINAVLSGGVDSVLVSRGQGIKMGGVAVRQIVLHMSSLAILLAATLSQGLIGNGVIAGTDAAGALWVGVGWAVAVGVISGVDATVALRRR